MKLLITTQIVDQNDPILGFFCEWISELAKRTESIEVICLKEGKHSLPSNVHVHTLGKTTAGNSSPGARILFSVRLKHLAWKLRNRYDAVFVHMNPEYILVAGATWKLLGKRIVLWYVHRSVTLSLRIALPFVDRVLTASKESFRIASKKVHVVGHGIALSQYVQVTKTPSEVLRVATVGRISPTKNLMLMLDAINLLQTCGENISFTIVGSAVTQGDQAYERELRKRVAELSFPVHFAGPVSNKALADVFSCVDVFVNMSGTGSVDKAVLEAMASGTPVAVGNDAFKSILPKELQCELTAPSLAAAIERADSYDGSKLRAIAEKNFSLSVLADKIVSECSGHNAVVR